MENEIFSLELKAKDSSGSIYIQEKELQEDGTYIGTWIDMRTGKMLNEAFIKMKWIPDPVKTIDWDKSFLKDLKKASSSKQEFAKLFLKVLFDGFSQHITNVNQVFEIRDLLEKILEEIDKGK